MFCCFNCMRICVFYIFINAFPKINKFGLLSMDATNGTCFLSDFSCFYNLNEALQQQETMFTKARFQYPLGFMPCLLWLQALFLTMFLILYSHFSVHSFVCHSVSFNWRMFHISIHNSLQSKETNTYTHK